MKFLVFLPLFILSFCALGQNARLLTTHKVETPLVIDGVLDEPEWQQVASADVFSLYFPFPGKAPAQQSAVKVLYADDALYIGAELYDAHPDSILQELTERDNFSNTDWFGVVIDAYQAGTNGIGYGITPRGVQMDLLYSIDDAGTDFTDGDQTWDTVWEDAERITENGWTVELRIPYSALRFPERPIQEWNINFVRSVRRNRQVSTWNPVDPNGPGLLVQSGKLLGIENIKPPVRLQATPFIVGYVQHYNDPRQAENNAWNNTISGGMDLKYGINDAFTLDMTLIPDFGEARTDNQILNLGPFEVRFDENRQFFTEGVDLFNKGGLFYSRRVGGTPLLQRQVYRDHGNNVLSNPATTRVLNATKVSGRNKNGLGIGVFNSVSAESHAIIRNSEGQEERITTNPLTNYNVLVFDQNLPNNSYATIVNTNVLREGDFYDANVTAGLFDLRNRSNTYSVNGSFTLSQKYLTDETDLGHRLNLELSKVSGRLTGALGLNRESHNYDPNDLGFLLNNNEQTFYSFARYTVFPKSGNFARYSLTGRARYSRLQKPNAFVAASYEVEGFAMTKDFFAVGAWVFQSPWDNHDYFEPRTDDLRLFLRRPGESSAGGFISSDYRRTLALDARVSFENFDESGRYNYWYRLAPRLRVNDHLFFVFEHTNTWNYKDMGWVSSVDNGDIMMGQRTQRIQENQLTARIGLDANTTLTIRGRHYWSQVDYVNYSRLNDDGSWTETETYSGDHNTHFNAFNIDAIFRWRFAPGSDLFVTYKNSILERQDDRGPSYLENFTNLDNFPMTNSLSVKLIYFIDYVEVFPGRGQRAINHDPLLDGHSSFDERRGSRRRF